MKKLYAFLFAAAFAATAYADGEPDLTGYWDFTGIVNTGGNWTADKAGEEPSTLSFLASTTDNVNYVFTYVANNEYNIKGQLTNDGGSWWIVFNKDPRGLQESSQRYLQVECGMINSSGSVGGFYNFRFSVDQGGDELEIGETVQMQFAAGMTFSALLAGYSPIFSWDTYETSGYAAGSRQIEFGFIFESAVKATASVADPTVTITEQEVTSTDSSATVTVTVETADLPEDATVTVEYAVVTEETQDQAQYNPMTPSGNDEYEATISFDAYEPGDYFVMVKATATSDGDEVASAGPVQAGTFTVKYSGIDSISGDLDGETRFFNLQGIEVNNPGKGLFIKVVNGKSTKVLVK